MLSNEALTIVEKILPRLLIIRFSLYFIKKHNNETENSPQESQCTLIDVYSFREAKMLNRG